MAKPTEAELLARLNQPGKGPPCSHHLGMRAVQADPETGTVKLAFTAPREFGNPMGQVQGGFLCAMLDEAAAVAVVVKSEFTLVVPDPGDEDKLLQTCAARRRPCGWPCASARQICSLHRS